jgi:hypothetical protein
MNATKTLSQFIVDTNYDKLPAAVVEAAKVGILDGVANMLAGSTQELAAIIGQYVKKSGGTPQSTVIGWGFKTNAPSAAFANRVFGHCLDYEIQGFLPLMGPLLVCPQRWPWEKFTTHRARPSLQRTYWGGRFRDGCGLPLLLLQIPLFILRAWLVPWEGPPPAPKS